VLVDDNNMSICDDENYNNCSYYNLYPYIEEIPIFCTFDVLVEL
jgi:hypothetical protein